MILNEDVGFHGTPCSLRT